MHGHTIRTGAMALILATSATPTVAEVSFLAFPLDCTLGQTCVIEDYVDADPGPGQRDYTCGLKSRDGHKGTDIALLGFDAMRAGVDVLAAADGIVAALRDGMPDRAITPASTAEIAGRECGNAVRLQHDNGDQTLYCHLKRGSLRVQKGQRVTQGAPLAQVGLSGLTNNPHLHFSVLRDGATIDPFAPSATANCDAAPQPGLWLEAIPYTPTGLFTAGFSDGVPEFAAVQSGAARRTSLRPSDPLVLYAHSFYAKAGDRLRFTASGPSGEVFDQTLPIDPPQAQNMRAFGKRAPDTGWPPGAYRGYTRLLRDGEIVATRHADVTITPD